MSDECSICCLKFTGERRKRQECESCNFEFCSECLKNDYKVKKETGESLSCFNCGVIFTQNFLKKVFTRNFFEKEVLNYLALQELEKEKDELQKAQTLAIYKKSIDSWKFILQTYYDERNKITETIKLLYRNRPIQPEFVEKIQEKRKKCNLGICRGFLNPDGLCETCNRWVCLECGDELREGHKCDEETLLTLKEIRKDSRPCPKCETPISKTDGCNQMWCPVCNTAFDYITGNIETGHIHNPEYLEHLRENREFIPRAPGDVRFCDDLTQYPAYAFSNPFFFRNFGLSDKFINYPENRKLRERYNIEILGKLHDIGAVISKIKNKENSLETSEKIKIKKRELQALFINGKITEEKWKIKIKHFLKIEESNEELKEIYTTFMRSLNDILSNCVEITFFLKDHRLDIFDTQLFDNTIEILKTQNDAILKNRSDIGFDHTLFVPFYLSRIYDDLI